MALPACALAELLLLALLVLAFRPRLLVEFLVSMAGRVKEVREEDESGRRLESVDCTHTLNARPVLESPIAQIPKRKRKPLCFGVLSKHWIFVMNLSKNGFEVTQN